MPNTPRSSVTSELETKSGSNPSTPRAKAAAASGQANAAEKNAIILNAGAGSYLPREKHWALTEWLARSTSAAKIEKAFDTRGANTTSSSDSSKNSSRNPSPSAGSR